MAAERKGDFGSKLRAARERRGVSLRQIAAQTKISVSVLEALERNDISRLPGGIFSRAFVRSYAAEIGLDPEEVIQDFIAQFPDDSVTAGHPQARAIEDYEAVESSRLTASAFLKLIAISLPIAGIALYYSIAGRRKPPAEPANQSPAIHDPDASRNRFLDTGFARSGVPLTVSIVARGTSVMTVVVDGKSQGEQAIAAGDRRFFAAERELVVDVADAAAVSLTVNGEPARPLGTSGQPATLNLTPANYKDYLISR
ncbi:MAG TPA: helix-turn-helix transcriptional regulator [Vicinamibacterales bacterium]|jgi:cytoskeletal protein RodZ